MCGSVIEVEMGFLDALAMVALWIAQAKEPLLEEVVLLVPESKGYVL